MPVEKGSRKMIKRFSKLTGPVIIAAASLTFLLGPSVGLANTRTESKAHQAKVMRQPVRQAVHFQIPAAKTENHGRSLEQVIQDQHDWYQMFE
jgi:hypothetical protein